MTPPEHALTGALAGTLLVYGLPGEPERRLSLVAWVALGALAPDVDALSLLFSHATYFGSAWYSHRVFFHSLAGCAVLAAVLGVALPALFASLRTTSPIRPPARPVPSVARVLALFAGGLVHLAGDLPTPPGPWSGIPLLFPLPGRFGGWSHLGWVNAVLIYLLGAAALA
ncbi:MAG: metal-dependent hydrolase, partial [Deltaproteobacteria bacterium]|nr:metal-dependent hydrolase [Deltaproteobacteria bacterium]